MDRAERRVAILVVSLLLTSCCYGVAEERDTYQSVRRAAKAKPRWSTRLLKPTSWFAWPFGKDDNQPIVVGHCLGETEEPREPAQVKEAAPATLNLQDELAFTLDEQAKFLRRQQVCDRLREIAIETGDHRLATQADLLEQRAWFVYQQRTSRTRLPRLTTFAADDGRSLLEHQARFGTTTALDRPLRSIPAHPRARASDRPEAFERNR